MVVPSIIGSPVVVPGSGSGVMYGVTVVPKGVGPGVV